MNQKTYYKYVLKKRLKKDGSYFQKQNDKR